MKQSYFQQARDVFPGVNAVLRLTFKAMDTRGSCAHLAVINHPGRMGEQFAQQTTSHFAMTSVIKGDKCAHLQNQIVLNACHYMS